MIYMLFRAMSAHRRKAEALREIRRNGWRCPYFGNGRRKVWGRQ